MKEKTVEQALRGAISSSKKAIASNKIVMMMVQIHRGRQGEIKPGNI